MISFVIPAWNEARQLPATLQAVHAAADAVGERHEVLVVDDASSDDTAAVARAHGARVVTVAHRQIAATRNAGARQALGRRLFFVDADTCICPATVRAAVRAMDEGAVGGGARVLLAKDAPARARWLLRIASPAFRWAGFAGGAFLFCTRSAYDATGGFDETRDAGEDLAFARTLRRHGRFVVLAEPVVTSGRKLHAHGILRHARLFVGHGLLGRRRARGTDREFWYGDGRGDDDRN